MRIKDRIRVALMANGCEMGYHALARAVFPESDYPRAWVYSSNGGPPGCFMALSRAVREMCEAGECHHEWPAMGERLVLLLRASAQGGGR